MCAVKVKFGMGLPIHGGFPVENPFDLIRELVILAEKGGFHSIWIEDHLDLPDSEIRGCEGEPDKDQPLEAWTTLAAIASWTRRVKIGTEVTPIPLRHPAILAKMVGTVDILSGGRVILGAGAGWNKPEFEAFGIPFDKRKTRFEKMEEAIEIIKSLWTKPIVNYIGKHYRLRNARLSPKPLQKPHPPIWFGGFSDLILQATVKYGDGWIHGTNVSPEKIKSDYDRLKAIAKEMRRNPEEIQVTAPFTSYVAKEREAAHRSIEAYIKRAKLTGMLARHFAEGTRLYAIWGTPRDCITKIEKYVEITGVKHFILDLRPASTSLNSLELLCDEVLPHFQK